MKDTSEETQGTQTIAPEQTETTTCCIVGGGPGGAMLALMLARKGVGVTLLEEHMDFARDFRGDTIHPSVMEILEQLGLADHLLQLEHTKASAIPLETTSGTFEFANLKRLKTRYPYILLLPQERFLDFITREAQRYPTFRLVMGARAEKLIEEDGYVHGVQYRGRDGWHEVRAVLTVGADGRFSRIRKLAGFEPVKSSPPMDVLWFRVPRLTDEPDSSGARLAAGHLLILLNRGSEWQVAYAITKGGYQQIKAAGLEQFRATIGKMMPDLAERMSTLTEWKQISVLSVESSYVQRWYRPGLLLIGDAAHVMTPVGGVGINYAIQDAVAATNILTPGLQEGKVTTRDLARVQSRRAGPTRIIQGFQRFVQNQFLQRVLASDEALTVPPLIRLMARVPLVRDMPARFIGFGPRRERLEQP